MTRSELRPPRGRLDRGKNLPYVQALIAILIGVLVRCCRRKLPSTRRARSLHKLDLRRQVTDIVTIARQHVEGRELDFLVVRPSTPSSTASPSITK